MILHNRIHEVDRIDICDVCERQGDCIFLNTMADTNIQRRVIIVQECEELREYLNVS